VSQTRQEPRRPRVDAQRNRDRLLVAAHAVFTEHGATASVHDIVKRAGVGVGTLYRHFPTREALVAAIFDQHIGGLVKVARGVLDAAPGSPVLRPFLEQSVELRRRDPFLKELFVRYPPSEGRLADVRSEMRRLLEALIDRARREGELRADFTLPDLAALFWSLGTVLDATEQAAPDAWRRHLGFVLDGLHPDAATPAPVPAMTGEQLAASMRHLQATRSSQRGGGR
jgi:AcrR family transcriptional regulator